MAIDLKFLLLKYWLVFLFGFIIAFIIIFDISLVDIWKGIHSLQAWQLGIVLSVFFGITFMNIFLRKYLLHSLGHAVRFRNLLAIHFSSMAAHYSTPAKLGFPVSVFLLKRLEQVPYPVGATVSLIELFTSTTVCGIIGLLGTFFYFMENRFIVPLFIFLAIGILSFLIIHVLRKHPETYLGRFTAKLTKSIQTLTINRLITYSIFMAFVQICSAANLYLLCHFFSLDISYTQALVIGSSAFFVGSLSMVPMGLGVREASVIFYLGRFGVESASALSIVTIQRLISTGLSLLVGSIIASLLARREIVRSNHNKSKLQSK